MCTSIFIDVLVDGDECKISDDMSSGRSVAPKPKNGFLYSTVLAEDMWTYCFVPHFCPLLFQMSTLESSSLCAPSFSVSL